MRSRPLWSELALNSWMKTESGKVSCFENGKNEHDRFYNQDLGRRDDFVRAANTIVGPRSLAPHFPLCHRQN
jgi:hypothetical protein